MAAAAVPAIFGDLALREAALFLDFDGVLVNLAPRPDEVRVSADLVSLLAVLESETNGATAIITGREIADLRRHIGLVPQSAMGCHGAERDLIGCPAFRHPLIGSDAVRQVQKRAHVKLALLPRVLLEPKPVGVALHYRQAPDLERQVAEIALDIASEFPAFEAHRATSAIELRPADIGKDKAIATAMSLPVMRGRVPIYVGADVTDEPAFKWVQDQGGIGIKVGEGRSIAAHRLADPAGVHALLAGWIEARWAAS